MSRFDPRGPNRYRVEWYDPVAKTSGRTSPMNYDDTQMAATRLEAAHKSVLGIARDASAEKESQE